MTQVLNPNDTGELPGGEGGNLDSTVRLPLADRTEKILLGHHVTPLPMVVDVRPVPPRAETLTDYLMTAPPRQPGLPEPAWTGRVGEFPTVEPAEPQDPHRPLFGKPGVRRAPDPRWARWAINAGIFLIGLSGGTLVTLAVAR